MFSKFDEDAQKVLLIAKKEMMELCHPYVGSEHLLLAILHNSNLMVTKLLNDYQITYDKYRKEIVKIIGIGKTANHWFLYTPLLKRVVENAILDSKEDGGAVTVEKLFISLLEEGDGVANRILLGMNVDIDLLYEKFSNKFTYHTSKRNKKLLIEEYAVDFNQKYREDGFDPVIGREEQVDRIIEILLRRTKNNPLLIGDAGVGKTAIVEELARRIVKGAVPKKLENKRILSVSMASLVAGTKYRGEFEERINKVVDELECEPDIILFIDEIHTLVGAGGAEGAIDASNILKPYLARGKIRIIGATTKVEYSKYLENDKALDRRFQKVFIEESSLKETENILLQLRDIYENYHGVKISDSMIRLIVQLSDRYVRLGKQPDKAIDILDEACSKASVVDDNYDKRVRLLTMEVNEIKEKKNEAIINHDYKLASELKEKQLALENKLNRFMLKKDTNRKIKEITSDILYDVVYAKTKIPVKKIIQLNPKAICDHLTKFVIGQNSVIKDIINITTGSKFSRKRVPYSLLLVGKSGVGKTFFVKEYAKLLYTKDAFIKIDMSEYKEAHTVSKIIGSPPGYVGYQDHNYVLERVKQNPYSVILLDEIEKANSSVLKLFLQVFDDGYMTSSTGEVVDFSNTTIFMTSNLGTNQQAIGFSDRKVEGIQNKLKEFLGVELMNRIDGVFFFQDITEKNIEKIIRMKLTKAAEKTECKNILSPEIVDKINNECDYTLFGARRVDKIIDTRLKDLMEQNT